MSGINSAQGSVPSVAPQALQSSTTAASANHYKNTTDEGLTFLLGTNFNKLADPNRPGVITRESLAKLAYFSGTGRDDQGISDLARAVLEKPGLFEKLDGYGKHKQDGEITQESLRAFEAKENGRFSSMSDKDLAYHFFDNFNDFRYVDPSATLDRPFAELTVGRLEKFVSSNRGSLEEKKFVRELLGRPELLEQLGLSGRRAPVTRESVEKALPNINP
ncbi:hypothetical protein Q9L58_010777 [Maublancomyces gigas]|uniref:Uncharacterized protein n=1 Tax=Discina gigas TaxID=1032678 RepID=A0ABR3G356_9PEZI